MISDLKHYNPAMYMECVDSRLLSNICIAECYHFSILSIVIFRLFPRTSVLQFFSYAHTLAYFACVGYSYIPQTWLILASAILKHFRKMKCHRTHRNGFQIVVYSRYSKQYETPSNTSQNHLKSTKIFTPTLFVYIEI